MKRVAPTLCAGLLLLVGTASAQTVYRVVGADGRVTFSDQLPVSPDNMSTLGSGGRTPAADRVALPYALRQAVEQHPVTLFTASNCSPCSAGRALLVQRGIPFTEKTVNTHEDVQALERLSGENALPFLTLGDQKIKGFSDVMWTQLLDSAGYPPRSVLPPGYRHPEATPLVTQQRLPPASQQDTPRPPRAAPTPPGQPAANPSGIAF